MPRGAGRARKKQPRPSRKAVKLDLNALEAAKRRVRHHPGVIGVDYGYIYEGGARTDRIGIRYHVRNKLPQRLLASEQRLPDKVDGVRTDVLEAGFKPHRTDPFAAAAILQPGLSIGNIPRRSDGTLGLFAKDRKDNMLCVLSNWHVLCGGSEARVGDEISQPGPLFLGPNPARKIAQLRRWVSPERQYDAAIAAVAQGVQVDTSLLDAHTRINGVAPAKPGMRLVKSGAASRVTHAVVDGIVGSYLVPYAEFGDTDRWMLGMRLVPDSKSPDREVSLPGDSGSVWVDADNGQAIALNFAGEDDVGPLNEYALAHSMVAICDLMEIDVAI